MQTRPHKALLQEAVTKAASFAGAAYVCKLDRFRELIVTLDITAAERDSADELYDFYIILGDGTSEWDAVHFLQIATPGAKRYTARVIAERSAEVTTATPGVAAETSATLKTDTAGAVEGIKTLASGKVRHGPFGDRIRYELVVAGTVVSGISYSIRIQANP